MLTKTDIKQFENVISKRLQNLATKNDLRKELKPIKSDISQIRNDVKTIVNFFDREYLELRKRVERIEEHLSLEPLST